MYVTKSFMMNPDDAELLRRNAKELGLTDSAFIKLCILIGSQELKMKDNYTFKYSYFNLYKPKDLIEERKNVNKEDAKIEKEERMPEEKRVEEKKVEEKTVEQPQPQRGKVKIQL